MKLCPPRRSNTGQIAVGFVDIGSAETQTSALPPTDGGRRTSSRRGPLLDLCSDRFHACMSPASLHARQGEGPPGGHVCSVHEWAIPRRCGRGRRLFDDSTEARHEGATARCFRSIAHCGADGGTGPAVLCQRRQWCCGGLTSVWAPPHLACPLGRGLIAFKNCGRPLYQPLLRTARIGEVPGHDRQGSAAHLVGHQSQSKADQPGGSSALQSSIESHSHVIARAEGRPSTPGTSWHERCPSGTYCPRISPLILAASSGIQRDAGHDATVHCNMTRAKG